MHGETGGGLLSVFIFGAFYIPPVLFCVHLRFLFLLVIGVILLAMCCSHLAYGHTMVLPLGQEVLLNLDGGASQRIGWFSIFFVCPVRRGLACF